MSSTIRDRRHRSIPQGSFPRRRDDTLLVRPRRPMPVGMHRRRSGARTAAWNKRPFPPPTLSYLGKLAPDAATRALADALLHGYSSCSLPITWTHDHDRAGAQLAVRAALRARFPDGQPYELAAYEYTWRQPADLELEGPAARAFAGVVYAEITESILAASHERYEAWRSTPAPTFDVDDTAR
jgi:hypothetical protein